VASVSVPNADAELLRLEREVNAAQSRSRELSDIYNGLEPLLKAFGEGSEDAKVLSEILNNAQAPLDGRSSVGWRVTERRS
jgi:hypothetical protein